jgi:Family of unknown function (DUF6281)
VRLALVFLLAALVVPGCGDRGQHRATGGAACAAIVEFQDREYFGEAMHGAAPDLAGRAGTAVVPSCDDVVPATTTESSTTVEAYKLAGIPAERALAVEDQLDIVYVARGVCEDETTPAGLVACLRRS